MRAAARRSGFYSQGKGLVAKAEGEMVTEVAMVVVAWPRIAEKEDGAGTAR